MIRVLFVDDEPRVLEGLRRALRKQKDWQITTADGGHAAMDALSKAEFDVIVTDMRMPEVNGVQLLTHTAQKYPGVIRIILSGQSEEDTIISSILSTHQFLSKPCNIDQLVEVVERSYAVRNALATDALQQIVSSIGTLPSLPQTYAEMSKLLNDENCSLGKLVEVLQKDPSISAKLLQLTNSSFFGIKREVRDVNTAVRILGIDTIRAIALATATFNKFSSSSSSEEFADLWDHITRCVDAANILTKKMQLPKEMKEMVFTGVVLHDVGHLVMFSRTAELSKKAREISRTERRLLHEVERELVGASHAEIGAYLLGVWGLPAKLVEIAAFHHEPWRCTAKVDDPVAVVFFVDLLEHLSEGVLTLDQLSPACIDYINSLNMRDTLLASVDASKDQI